MKVLVIDNGNSGNNGVMGMAVGLRHNLPENWELTVSLDNPSNEEKDRKRFLTDGVETKPNILGYIHVYMSKPGFRLLFPLVAMLWLVIQKFLPLLIPSHYVRYRDYDVVISLCGEDFFSDNWSLYNCIFRFTQCLCALSLGRKLVVFAQTFGPFQRGWSRTMAQFCMRKATLVTARDHRSFEEAESLVGSVNHVKETRDLAFLLKPSSWEEVVTRHPELKRLPSRFVAVSVSRTFAVNVLLSKGMNNGLPEQFHEAMGRCLDDFVEATKVPIVFIPQVVVGPFAGDDRCEAREVLKRMNQKGEAFVCNDEYTAGDLKALIGRADMVVAGRMHAQVAAVSQGIPVLALAYSPKSLDVIGKAFEYEFVLDARRMAPNDFAKKAATMMIRLENEREEASKILLKSLPDVLKWSRSNFDLLLSACSAKYPGEAEGMEVD